MVMDSQASKALHPPLIIIIPSIARIRATEGSARCKLFSSRTTTTWRTRAHLRPESRTPLAKTDLIVSFNIPRRQLLQPWVGGGPSARPDCGLISTTELSVCTAETCGITHDRCSHSHLQARAQEPRKKNRPWRKGCTPECANASLAGTSANPLTAESRHLAVCLGKMTFI